MDTIEGLGK